MDDLDRWTRVLPLGSGAFGEVHLSWDTLSREWVALKRFTGQDELGLLRFVIESRIRVSHPHLVRTQAFRLVDDRAWLVTQLARGGSLRALMARTGALPWGWVAEAVDQVLSALVALHATGVVHRDLKPANLLLRDGGAVHPHLLVGDFGIATWRTVSMTGVGAAIGTPGYLAPEYLDGQQPSPAIDVFALGVLAAELLAGARLVHYSNALPALPSTWSDLVPLPPSVPPQLAAVLRRMADPDPRRRYLDCTQAREALLAASPPGGRGDLTTVAAQDLLAALPPGWTLDGPENTETPTTVTVAGPDTTDPPSEPHVGPGWARPPIDGGPTALVDQSSEPTAVAPAGRPATPPQTPSGGLPEGHANGAAVNTPPVGSPTTAEEKPDRRSPASKAARKARRRRKTKRAVLLLVALLLIGGAGTLWWAATHRTIAGQATPAGSSTDTEAPQATWQPVIVEECKPVDIDRVRKDKTERCQRTLGTVSPQNWVKAPPTGFPKSDTKGPFPGEKCAEADTDRTTYSPVGDRLQCTAGEWQRRA